MGPIDKMGRGHRHDAVMFKNVQSSQRELLGGEGEDSEGHGRWTSPGRWIAIGAVGIARTA